MRKLTSALLAVLLLVIGSACSGGMPPQDEEGIVVYASIFPLYDFASRIAGDRARVLMLMPEGGEPHDWEPAPADIAGLEGADILFYNGLGLEHWIDGVLASLGNDLVAVATSEAVPDLNERDPHVWLSPVNAGYQASAILNALVAADPEGEKLYRSNYEALAGELESLDDEYRRALNPYRGRSIVVAHQAFGYLCGAYGLQQIAVQGFSPDSEPDPAQMAHVIDLAREEEVRVIFFEEMVSPAVAEAVAREIGAETDVLNPLETRDPDDTGEDYFSLMRRNLDALLRALA